MAKKQKKATPERVPTKHQLSKWQRQTRIRRIIIIATIVFLVGISSWVGIGYYKDYKARVAAWHEVMIDVNGVNFTMEYFVTLLDAYTTGMNSTTIGNYGYFIANTVSGGIIDAELLRQGAKSLNITVTTEEVDAKITELGYDEAYREIVRASLLEERLKEEYFGPGLNKTMEQANVKVMLVESKEVAAELIAEIEDGGNLTDLAEEFSCN